MNEWINQFENYYEHSSLWIDFAQCEPLFSVTFMFYQYSLPYPTTSEDIEYIGGRKKTQPTLMRCWGYFDDVIYGCRTCLTWKDLTQQWWAVIPQSGHKSIQWKSQILKNLQHKVKNGVDLFSCGQRYVTIKYPRRIWVFLVIKILTTYQLGIG